MTSEDLLDHFKVEADVLPQYTLQYSYQPNRTRGGLERIETRWQKQDNLGEGRFGQVWHESSLLDDGTRRDRAVKSVKRSRMRRVGIDFKKELLALATFSKEEYRQSGLFVVFYGWYETEDSVFFAMEWFKHGDLAQHIADISTEDEVRHITTDLLHGLRIMHAKGFAHRDLKPQNIFVARRPPQSGRWLVKIGDFGIAKRARNEETAFRTQTGTPYYLAPEVQGFIDDDEETSAYTNAVDMWSLGCVVYHISVGKVPFSQLKELRKYCRIPTLSENESLALKIGIVGTKFVQRLMEPLPAQRITVTEALRDAWIMSTQPVVEVQLATGPESINRSYSPIMGTSFVTNGQGIHAQRTLAHTSDPESDSIPSCSNAASGRLAADRIVLHSPMGSRLSTTPWYSSHDGHTDAICCVAISPDGTIVATSSKDSTVRVERIGASMPPQILRHHVGPALCVTFSTDGRMLASCSTDGSIALCTFREDVGIYELTYARMDLLTFSRCVRFSPDDTVIASCSSDATIQLWDTGAHRALKTLCGHTDGMYRLEFSPIKKIIASCSFDNTFQCWDYITGETVRVISDLSSGVRSFTYSPCGRRIASASRDGTIRLFDITASDAVLIWVGRLEQVWDVACSPDGAILASSSENGIIRFWDMSTGFVIHEKRMEQAIGSIRFSPDGRKFVYGLDDGSHGGWMLERQSGQAEERRTTTAADSTGLHR